MTGMDNQTGQPISGLAYLRQRLHNALTTPVGSTVLLRERGFDYKAITDQPINKQHTLDLFYAVAVALASPLAGLPDFRLTRVTLSADSDFSKGKPVVDIFGHWDSAGEEVSLEGLAL